MAGFGSLLMRRIKRSAQPAESLLQCGAVFAVLMVFTACSMAFAHGSNDVASAVGPLAAVASTVQSGGVISAKAAMPWWILMVGAVGIVVGLATYGWRVIATVGRKITELTQPGFRRRTRGRGHSRYRLCHRPAHLHHPHPGGCGVGVGFARVSLPSTPG